jgi:hypothetical protein
MRNLKANCLSPTVLAATLDKKTNKKQEIYLPFIQQLNALYLSVRGTGIDSRSGSLILESAKPIILVRATKI